MTTTNTVLAELQAAHPDLDFQVIDKVETAYADEAQYPDQLIGFLSKDVLIVEPFRSTCGRFTAMPDSDYGLSESAARLIRDHNCPLPPSPLAPSL